MQYTIYRHTNITSGKCYIGKTGKSWELRWTNHIQDAFERNSQFHFHCALRKYGINDWNSEILEVVPTLVEANLREIAWIAHFDSYENGYNMTLGGDGGCSGIVKQKISAKLRGRKLSIEHRQKMSDSAQKYWSESHELRRQTLATRNQTEAARLASREAQNRRWSDPEKRKEMGNKHRGKIVSEETRAKISAANIGRKFSDEQRAEMRAKRKAMWADPEFKAQQLEKRRIAREAKLQEDDS